MRACKPCAAAAFLVLVLAPAAFAQQPNPAGRIKVVTGSAFIVRNSGTVAAPDSGALGMVLNFVRGMTAYVSGRIAKMAPDSIRLETPAAIVGVRGTTLAINVEQ